ncbi:hypothetical protein WMF11_46230 [Sorangium sp. So ce295]|uniref:hypothetical protein n=1 Tax=Sorangium sp. So ce295 TaxID=3133295 RepID=UPI003F62FEB6
MKPVVAYQVHLMSQMRNKSGMAKGLKLLGVDPSEVDAANAMVADVGLSFRQGNDGHLREVDVIPRFLGAPRRIEPTPVEDSAFWTTQMFYSLPVWPEMELEFSFNEWGHLSDKRVEAARKRREIETPEDARRRQEAPKDAKFLLFSWRLLASLGVLCSFLWFPR